MKPRNWWNVENSGDDEAKARNTTLFLKDVYNILNGGGSLKDNFKGTLLTVTFSSANTDVAIRHGLDVVPSNYIMCGSDVATTVYDGVSSADKTFIYLRASVAATARLFIF